MDGVQNDRPYDFFIPAAEYRGPEVARREREKLWPRVWQIACREEEIAKPGDFVRYDILDESVLIVRLDAERIRGYYNVCQHRGRQLLEAERGNVGQGFFCRFHGWRYHLDGSLDHAYAQEDWSDCPAFADGSLDLKQPRIDRWGGWIWVNMDPAAPPLAEYLAPLPHVFRNFRLADMRFAWAETLIAPVNWKVIVEAFNEGYHSGATHSFAVDYRPLQAPGGTHGLHGSFTSIFPCLAKVKDETGRWTMASGLRDLIYYQAKELHDTLQALVSAPMMRAITRMRERLPEDASMEAVYGALWALQREEVEATGAVWPEELTPLDLAEAGTDWHIFPNTIVLPSADGVLWYRMRPSPEDDDRSIFDIWCLRRYPPGGEPAIERVETIGFDAFRGRNAFLEQDFSNMRAVNKGMRSRGWAGAFTNPSQERQIVHFHRMLHAFMDR